MRYDCAIGVATQLRPIVPFGGTTTVSVGTYPGGIAPCPGMGGMPGSPGGSPIGLLMSKPGGIAIGGFMSGGAGMAAAGGWLIGGWATGGAGSCAAGGTGTGSTAIGAGKRATT